MSELTRQLASGDPAPIYLLLGEETFFREAALVAIRRSVLGDEKEDNGVNCDLLYGDEVDALNRCDTLPAFAARRLVIIRNAGALRPRETERLMPYLKAPVETTCLVLASEKVDGRLKFFQTLKVVAVTVDCSPLDARFMPEWIQA